MSQSTYDPSTLEDHRDLVPEVGQVTDTVADDELRAVGESSVTTRSPRNVCDVERQRQRAHGAVTRDGVGDVMPVALLSGIAIGTFRPANVPLIQPPARLATANVTVVEFDAPKLSVAVACVMRVSSTSSKISLRSFEWRTEHESLERFHVDRRSSSANVTSFSLPAGRTSVTVASRRLANAAEACRQRSRSRRTWSGHGIREHGPRQHDHAH